MRPGPIVKLNRAIAIGYANSPEAGISALQEIADLKHYYLYYSALGDFYTEAGDIVNAQASYEKAITLTMSVAEKNLLRTKLA